MIDNRIWITFLSSFRLQNILQEKVSLFNQIVDFKNTLNFTDKKSYVFYKRT